MARGINKVILIGNLGQKPELRYTPHGSSYTQISVATGEAWMDKNGQRQERTEWHRVVLWNRLAEVARDYLDKGSRVYIEGSLRTRKWTKDGADHYTTEITAEDLQMLDAPPNTGRTRATPEPESPSKPKKPDPGLHDDIPF